jgi:hypothetical protein
MKLPHRRQFLHLAAGAATLPAVSRVAWAQAYPTRIVIRTFPQFAQRLGRVELSNFAEFDTSSSRFVPRACPHKSALCKRGSVNVRFAPKATEVLRCRELTRCANSGCEQSQQKKLLDDLVGGDKQPRWHGQAERTLGDWSSN